MTNLQRQIYGAVIRLHPASFRDEFGRDMARDFEDALPQRGFTPLLGDAIVSLARQWTGSLISEPEVEQSISRHPLLAGQYATISLGRLTAFDFARASVLSVLFLVLFAYAETAGHRAFIGFHAGIGDRDTEGGRLAFEVASVRPNKSEFRDQPTMSPSLSAGGSDQRNGGLFAATDEDLSTYILFAFDMPTSQYQAVRNQLPDWAQTERFDIHARANGNPTKDEMRLMMQSLLADRFSLAIHAGKGQAKVYLLEPAEPGKLGPHLRPHDAQAECPDVDARSTATISGGFPLSCGELVQLQPTTPGDARFAARNVGMGSIAKLANDMFHLGQLDRPVINRTGLTGTFDLTLEFMPTADAPPLPPGAALPDGMGEELPQALQQQLGLKLVPSQGLEDTFVIDRVEHPSEN